MKYSQVLKLSENLSKLASQFDQNHELMVLAEESEDQNVLNLVAQTLANTQAVLAEAASSILLTTVDSQDERILENILDVANKLDASGNPELSKYANVLDEILLTIGASKAQVAAAKRAQDEEVAKLKSQAAPDKLDPYKMVKTEHDRQNKVEEARKAISDKVKEYRPMEAPLQTRSCPDHPGAQMTRISEHVFQCAMDKKIYDYQGGYSTMKGNKIPGGDVSYQTQSLHDRPNEFMSFDTRESKLNQR